MSKKTLLRSREYPYHVTARSNNREWFYLPLNEVWEIMLSNLFCSTLAYGLRVHAFVLMSNHYHLIASTPDANIDAAMNYFMRETSRAINFRSKRMNHIFGGRYKWCSIQAPLYYAHALKYVYLNPVSAGICNRADAYEFSTLHGLMGHSNLRLPLYGPPLEFQQAIPNDLESLARWISQRPQRESDLELVRLALKKETFQFSSELVDRLGSKLEQVSL